MKTIRVKIIIYYNLTEKKILYKIVFSMCRINRVFKRIFLI